MGGDPSGDGSGSRPDDGDGSGSRPDDGDGSGSRPDDGPGADDGSGTGRCPGSAGRGTEPGGIVGFGGLLKSVDAPAGAGGGEDLGEEDPGADELALRRMFQGAVQDLAPSDGALDHLRKAVPARRACKRQLLVGVAAAALLLGTAIPAFVHVASSNGGGMANPLNLGKEKSTEGNTGSPADKVKEKKESAKPSDRGSAPPKDKGKGKTSRAPGDRPGKDAGGGGDAPTGGPDDVQSASTICGPGQLGVSSTEVSAPDAGGVVYGVFRVANVSGGSCTVEGGGSVSAAAQGAADPARISVAQHVSGGPAGSLPDPSMEASSLLLAPSQSYEVRFAWVPSETCPVDGGESPDPTPTDGGEGGSVSEGSGGEPGGLSAQLIGEDGGPQDGSVALTHTAQGGAPSAGATIPNACAGTVYRTGLLSAG
ncbi:hypothetical protein ACH432_03095 [Streptomyces jumonjinensis]|uniref:hypothetical protein n=1 Tax=Streptomyces jumonjinensis TaxID=1945 RepID=UPI0037A03476